MQEGAHARSVIIRLYAIAAFAAVVAFFVDQLTKQIGRGLSAGMGPFPEIATVVRHENYGLVANLPVPLPLIVLLTIIVLALVLWMLVIAIRARQTVAVIGLGILVGGALGNLMDRLIFGYVFDWILLFGRSALNIADLCILIGTLTYLAGTRRSSTAAGA